MKAEACSSLRFTKRRRIGKKLSSKII